MNKLLNEDVGLKSESADFRLPGNISPTHYDLDIITHFEEKIRYEGDVKIKIICKKPTDTIVLNVRDLTINEKVTLQTLGGHDVTIANTTSDTTNDFFTIKTTKTLLANEEYLLSISFEAPLKEDLVGYYYSSYDDKTTMGKKYLAVTHFEPSDARKAFPCFDEPALKATFRIRLGHIGHLTAISNMPLKMKYPLWKGMEEPFPNYHEYFWSEFETTLPMSTYLVAFMVSEFKFAQSELQPNQVTFRVWTRRDALEQTGFAATVGPKFLSFYEDYFDVKYPLPKQDLLAIPDFKIGAMENWGIITFRESALLLDEKTTSSAARLHIASIIAHELAHMWFGNLVTMNWWTDLWLKEGFATYMAGVAVHNEFPEWNSLDAEAMSDLLRVFDIDSLKTSHPVSVPIGNSKEISQVFDAISYDKGSFLLGMMSLFLGEEVFRRGVSEYLKKHQYSNAEQDDLWESLTQQAHLYAVLPTELSVKHIMDTWTLQTGYPVITVERDYTNKKVSFSQKRFLAIRSENESDYKGSWWVPLSLTTQKELDFSRTQPMHWLPDNQKYPLVLDIDATEEQWIIVNNRAAGLYKVNYDRSNWEYLTEYLTSADFEKIDVLNRALLIVDSMDLANSGFLNYETALYLITYLEQEKSFVPWSAALNKLHIIKAKLCRTAHFGTFNLFTKRLLTPLVESLGPIEKTPSSFERGRLINLISPWAFPHNIGQYTTQAMALFDQWMSSDNPDEVNPIQRDIRRALYSLAVERGGEKVWDFLWTRYRNANVVAEKNNILMALTNTREVWMINRYLEWTLTSGSGIRKQDASIIFKMIASKEMGFYVAQNFFYRNIERISKYFGANSNLMGHYFTSIADQTIYKHDHDALKEFSIKHKGLLAPASLAVEQALETVALNVRWANQYSEHIGSLMKRILSSGLRRLRK